MKLGIPVYDGINLLDVAGPLEMFTWVDEEKGLQPLLLSIDGASVLSLNKVRFEVHASFAAAPELDVLWVPGGGPIALGNMMADANSPYIAYLRQVAENAKWVCSVCEGGTPAGTCRTARWAYRNHILEVRGLPAPFSRNHG
ncbi:DJ-1/PfpI family protein [Mesorhizobium sp. M1365]|uniref:DJ-1/PfpI family protein n=1 Tax=Mesorhizobium sp. M1365 TaxID=2957090 RepID=UPI0033359CE3